MQKPFSVVYIKDKYEGKGFLHLSYTSYPFLHLVTTNADVEVGAAVFAAPGSQWGG